MAIRHNDNLIHKMLTTVIKTETKVVTTTLDKFCNNKIVILEFVDGWFLVIDGDPYSSSEAYFTKELSNLPVASLHPSRADLGKPVISSDTASVIKLFPAVKYVYKFTP